jgi:hypothetical protein
MSEIKTIINNNYLARYVNELDAIQKQPNSQEKKIMLENVIQNFINQQKADNDKAKVVPNYNHNCYNPYFKQKYNPSIATPTNHHELTRDGMFNQLDHYAYNKEWCKLEQFHKMVKIREYYDFMPSCEFKTYLLEQFNALIVAKQLNKNTHVIYDVSKQKIVSIPALKYNKYNIGAVGDFSDIVHFKCAR